MEKVNTSIFLPGGLITNIAEKYLKASMPHNENNCHNSCAYRIRSSHCYAHLLIIHSTFSLKEKPAVIVTKHMPFVVCGKPAGVKEMKQILSKTSMHFFLLFGNCMLYLRNCINPSKCFRCASYSLVCIKSYKHLSRSINTPCTNKFVQDT